jgi:hypothetical protein
MMNSTSRTILQMILTTDVSLAPSEREVMQRLINGESETNARKIVSVDRPLLVTQRIAARLLSVNRVTIYRMAKAGMLHPVEILPGTVRYDYRELAALAERGIKREESATGAIATTA